VTTNLIERAAARARIGQPERPSDGSREARSQHEIRRAPRPSADIDQVLDDSFPASDPPSWTSAISRVAATQDRPHSDDPLVRRIRADFLEMPGLCLTLAQAQRLWRLEPRACEALLTSLINARFLRRTDRGLFVLRTGPG
jgi:hypothetical protein